MTRASTVQSPSRADSAGWPFHARQNEYRKTAPDCWSDTLPESPARAQISAARPPENVGQRFPSGLRLSGVQDIYRSARCCCRPEAGRGRVSPYYCLCPCVPRRAPVTSWHSQSSRLQSNSATSVRTTFVRTAWVRGALLLTALARRREESRNSDCSGCHPG